MREQCVIGIAKELFGDFLFVPIAHHVTVCVTRKLSQYDADRFLLKMTTILSPIRFDTIQFQFVVPF